jgi:hypothetical protein
MSRLARFLPAAVLALLGIPALAGAWPAALETGAPIRVTAPSIADTAVVGSFVRHDDSTLTFQPERHHGKLRVRFADIERLEVNDVPAKTTKRSSTVLAVVGGVVGGVIGATWAGGSTGSVAAGLAGGALLAIPGFLIGGLAGGLFGGAAAVATPDTSWVEVPRPEWAGATAYGTGTPPDTTTR